MFLNVGLSVESVGQRAQVLVWDSGSAQFPGFAMIPEPRM